MVKRKNKIMAMALILMLCVNIITGCKSTETKEQTSQQSTEQKSEADGQAAKQITIARNIDVVSMDPVLTVDTVDLWTLSLICPGLVRASENGGDIEGNLSKEWEISEDQLTYTFHLRDGLKFSDGTEVTGDDWIFTIERARDTTDSIWNYTASNIAKVEAPDNQTVVITLKEPNTATLSYLSMPNTGVQSKAYFEKCNQSYEGTAPIGAGLYAMTDWQKDNYMLLTKNSYYYDPQYPLTDEIKFMVVADDDSRVMQLQSGEVDVITNVPYSNMNVLKAMDGIKTLGIESTGSKYLIFNTTKDTLKDQKVRQALLYATNKEELVNLVLNGYGEQAVSYMPKNGLYWDSSIEPVQYDVEKAKALLTEAGYPNGFDIEFLVRSGNAEYQQIATVIKEQWAKIGVNVDLVSLESASLLEKEYAMEHSVLIGSWSDDIPDPSQLGSYFWNYDTSLGFYTGYNSATATDLMNQALSEPDKTKLNSIYGQLQEIFYQDVPAINLYHAQTTVAMNGNIEGFVQSPYGVYMFEKLEKTEK